MIFFNGILEPFGIVVNGSLVFHSPRRIVQKFPLLIHATPLSTSFSILKALKYIIIYLPENSLKNLLAQ